MSEIRACIFDLDGVLVETSEFHYLAWSRLGDEIGVTISKELNERLKGVSRRTSLDILLAETNLDLGEDQKLELELRKNNWYLEYLQDMSPSNALPNVVPFLEELQKEGIKLAVGSSSRNATLILNKLELNGCFEIIVDGNAVSEAKPNPEIFLKAASALQIDPTECVVFEDAISGIQAAVAGNFKCIGVGSSEVLQQADLVIPSFANFNHSKMMSFYETERIASSNLS